jgi:hypothetical protein
MGRHRYFAPQRMWASLTRQGAVERRGGCVRGALDAIMGRQTKAHAEQGPHANRNDQDPSSAKDAVPESSNS